MTTTKIKYPICSKHTVNGRVYDFDIDSFKNAVNNMKLIDGRICGELEHPVSNDVELKNVSHIVSDINVCDDVVSMQIGILDTPRGKVLHQFVQNYIDSNDNVDITKAGLCVAPRMLGKIVHDTDENGNELETTHYDVQEILTWDIVKGSN